MLHQTTSRTQEGCFAECRVGEGIVEKGSGKRREKRTDRKRKEEEVGGRIEFTLLIFVVLSATRAQAAPSVHRLSQAGTMWRQMVTGSRTFHQVARESSFLRPTFIPFVGATPNPNPENLRLENPHLVLHLCHLCLLRRGRWHHYAIFSDTWYIYPARPITSFSVCCYCLQTRHCWCSVRSVTIS